MAAYGVNLDFSKSTNATGIIAGTLDGPTVLNTIGHIFVGEKSDFYEIHDDAPQFERSSGGELVNDYK